LNWVDIGIFSNLFFNSWVLFTAPFEFYAPYAFIVLLLPFFILKYRFPREVLYILIPLVLTGAINILVDNDTFGNFFKIFANIALNLIFYRYVMEYYEFDVKRVFKMYLKGCFVISIIGLIQVISYWLRFTPGYNFSSWLPLNKWVFNPGGLGMRVNALFCEPSNFGTSIAPGFFIALYSVIKKDYSMLTRKMALVIMFAYICTFSSLAYLGIFITIVFLAINYGLVRYLFIAIPVTIILFSIAYNNVTEFRARVDGMKALFVDDILNKEVPENEAYAVKVQRIRRILSKVHGSSFVLYNNYYIATENFKNNPIFGSGLGSHEFAFEKYNLNYLLGDIYKFNTADANSMFLRVMSELGLMGIVFVFLFIFKFYVSKNLAVEEDETYWVISNALLVLILIQLIRQGNYTFTGFFFYAWMYYYNSALYAGYREKLNKEAELKKENPEELNEPVTD
jgi:hypothetical protein